MITRIISVSIREVGQRFRVIREEGTEHEVLITLSNLDTAKRTLSIYVEDIVKQFREQGIDYSVKDVNSMEVTVYTYDNEVENTEDGVLEVIKRKIEKNFKIGESEDNSSSILTKINSLNDSSCRKLLTKITEIVSDYFKNIP